MEINFSTENLIVTNYPGKAGGKFINMVLALHPNIVFQHENLARLKMTGKQDLDSSFTTALKVLEAKRDRGVHVEYDCTLLADFNSLHLDDDIMADEKRSNQLWKELTNQEKFYFLMVDHDDGRSFKRYPNRKTLRLINFDWIVSDRGGPYPQSDKCTQEHLSNSYDLDMSSIKDTMAFDKEINKILDFIGVEQPENEELFKAHLETLRKTFLETYKIGFIND